MFLSLFIYPNDAIDSSPCLRRSIPRRALHRRFLFFFVILSIDLKVLSI